jgi:hypothetical protein
MTKNNNNKKKEFVTAAAAAAAAVRGYMKKRTGRMRNARGC